MSRYRLTLDRVLNGTEPAYTPEFLLEDIYATPGRRFTNFSGDLSGRWIGALSASARTFGESFPPLHEVVSRTLALQQADGHFGGVFHGDRPDDNDLALLWGNGRLLVGLMEYYELTNKMEVLKSAKKLGDFLVRIGTRFNSQEMADAFSADHYASSYICWTQQTEGLALLYAATHEQTYLDLCVAISRHIARRPGDHVHGYLTSLRGVLHLYSVTGNPAHLDQVVRAWRDIQNSGDLLITGGLPERWSPKRDRTEGCAECDWLRLNLGLYRATGETIYLETAQNTYFNEFAMNQFASGDYGHARLDAQGVTQTVSVRAWWCCTLHGLRTFSDVHQAAFRVEADHIRYDLPIDSRIRSEAFSADASSSLATSGTVRIDVHSAGKDRTFSVFQPSWTKTMSLSRNGTHVPGLTIEGPTAGDVILVDYGMGLAVRKFPHETEHGPLRSLHYGPWLLGIRSTATNKYFNELYEQNLFDLASVQRSAKVSGSRFEVPEAAATVHYLPAEFPEQPASCELHAVATQTASPPQNWQILFASQPGRGV